MKLDVSLMSAEEIVNKYMDMIYRLAYSRIGNVSDAEDVTQEVFLKLIRSGKKFNDEEHIKAWLIKVAVNQIKSLATSAYARHRADYDEVENLAYVHKSSSGVVEAMRELPEKYFTVLHLFYFEELSIKQIAKMLKSSEGTIKARLSRGREQLKLILQEDYDFE